MMIISPLGHNSLSRPKSLLVSSPSTKLLTLEEAQARTQAQINSPVTADSKYIEVGEGPAALQGKFHTVIEFPTERSMNVLRPWQAGGTLGRSDRPKARSRSPRYTTLKESRRCTVRGGPRSSSDALSTLLQWGPAGLPHPAALQLLRQPDPGPQRRPHTRQQRGRGAHLRARPHFAPAFGGTGEDVDLSPPDIGMASLDFDPMSFQCSLPDCSFSFPLGLSDVATCAAGESTSVKRSQGGVDNGSAPVSPSFLGKFTIPFLSPDLSPATREKAESKKLTCSMSFPDKPLQAASPIKSKATILAPLAISEPFAMEFPSKLTESHSVTQPSPPPSGLPRDSPPLMGSVLLRTGEPSLSEAFQMELHCKPSAFDTDINTESQDSTGEESTAQQPSATSSQEQPGAVASMEFSKGLPGPLSSSSVSLLPPLPPQKNSACMLVLCRVHPTGLHPDPGVLPVPVQSPIRPMEPSHSLDWTPPPALCSPRLPSRRDPEQEQPKTQP
ncbi:hypothetical protein J4Q44_G00126860 [Coregonus suidteri]|uniref:Uncharacterized protein n=1 Tax=Coregonus suidteri TaxID=861788 RepID=A0AAN8QYT7_9TELE